MLLRPATTSGQKYSVKDEESQDRNIVLPLVGAIAGGWTFVPGPGTGGCIIDIGAAGEWDDYGVVTHCAVKIKDKYVIFYRGDSGSGNANAMGIGVASCPIGQPPADPINFTKHGRIIAPGAGGLWMGQHVSSPSVVIDKNANLIRMWFLASNTVTWPMDLEIGYAWCSLDADYTVSANWTVSAASIFAPGSSNINHFSAVKLANDTYMFAYQHRSDYNFYMATSNAPDSGFVEFGTPIISYGPAGAWDDLGLAYLAIYYDSGILYGFYLGLNDYRGSRGTTGDGYIGMALVSIEKLFSVWTKWDRNPVFTYGVSGRFDDVFPLQPSIMRVGRMFYNFVGGRNTADGRDRIGLYKSVN